MSITGRRKRQNSWPAVAPRSSFGYCPPAQQAVSYPLFFCPGLALAATLADLVHSERIRVVSSGGRLPMIDLADVPAELNEAAADVDLLFLEGMGRSIESNFHATFF